MHNHEVSDQRFRNKVEAGLPGDSAKLNAPHANSVLQVATNDLSRDGEAHVTHLLFRNGRELSGPLLGDAARAMGVSSKCYPLIPSTVVSAPRLHPRGAQGQPRPRETRLCP